MNPLHHALLEARVAITAPYRRARLERMSVQGAAPISVPFYHRVADSHPNDWTISTDQFRIHVEHCRDNFDLIDLAEVQRRIRASDSPRPSVSFTFDDGYAENSEFALPLLIEHRVPCTYFVATAHVRQQSPFPHDVQAGVHLAVNSVRQLREASAAGIEIGLHTRNHVDFAAVTDAATVRREIIEAKDELEQMIGCAVRYFAFPYGLPQQLTGAAIEAVGEAGLLGFCSAFGGYNLVGRDAFHIRRFHGDPQFARLRNWLSFDRSKVWKEPQVRYALPAAAAPQLASDFAAPTAVTS
jgi:peptidoglycan/xylan/chitin deacetylase (PgdA/CDA1 family)